MLAEDRKPRIQVFPEKKVLRRRVGHHLREPCHDYTLDDARSCQFPFLRLNEVAIESAGGSGAILGADSVRGALSLEPTLHVVE